VGRLTAKMFQDNKEWVVAWGENQIHSVWRPDTLLNLSLDQTLVVDLTEVEYIDSQGLKFLLDLHKKLSEQNLTIILQNPTPHLRRLFRIMQFERIFEIEVIS
jgi:anti-anti-sigma factor